MGPTQDDLFLNRLKKLFPQGHVLSKAGDLFPYALDAALNRCWPGAVIFPRTTEDVVRAVSLAREFRVPYVVRGAGTNLCGGTLLPAQGLVIHVSRLNKILSIDKDQRRAWVEPGVVNLHLHQALAPLGLFYAPDPASQKACTIGGNVGTNAGGPHCLKYGVTSHHVTGLEFVRPNGTLARVSIDDGGFDWPGFMVGSEGTLGIATKIELNLLVQPPDVQTFLVAFPTMEAAAQTVTEIIAAGIVPATLEVMDGLTVRAVEAFVKAGYPTEAESVLLIEVDGVPERTHAEGERVRVICDKNGGMDFRRARDEAEREKLWEGRRGAYAAMARLAPNVWVEDGVVPRTRLPEALRRVRAIADRSGLRMGLIAHAGDGNLHPNIIFDERNTKETDLVRAAGQEMLRVCVDLGGSISGEHGIGREKREAMRWLFPAPTLNLFSLIKFSLDPENLCNPDKMIPTVAADLPQTLPFLLPEGHTMIRDVPHLQSLLRGCDLKRCPVFIRGTGSRGFPVPLGSRVIETTGLNRVLEYDQANLTLTAEAGATVSSVRALLRSHGHFLHVSGEGTLGGYWSTHARGEGSLTGQVLGLKAVLANGDLVTFGGKVMKNVAGYDVTKLFAGAWGSLGVVVEMTWRVHSVPLTEGLSIVPVVPDFCGLPSADLHREMKRVFDPNNLLNPTLFDGCL